MNKLTKVLISGMFTLISTQSSYANYPNNEGNPYYSQEQTSYDQGFYPSSPNMANENSFIRQSDNRMNQMRQDNRNMMDQDRRMIREGYDPNENYQGENAGNIQDSSRTYPKQEQMMRGQYSNNTNDKSSSSSMYRGTSNPDTNASWDTTDDQTMKQSSANTVQSSRWNSGDQ